jgi:FkbM family methyltransferase
MDLIFDIGANRGLFTDKCLNNHPNVKIIAVEPNPNLYLFLNKKYEGNNNIIVLDNVVSSSDGQAIDFYISNTDTISTASKEWITESRFTNQYRWGQAIKINSISLDKLIKDYNIPNLIKIDVEGYELEVISGLTSKVNEICFEWAEEQYLRINQTCEHLMNIGYTEFGYIEGDEYLTKPKKYTNWYDLEIHNDIDVNRKNKWGMIWVK